MHFVVRFGPFGPQPQIPSRVNSIFRLPPLTRWLLLIFSQSGCCVLSSPLHLFFLPLSSSSSLPLIPFPIHPSVSFHPHKLTLFSCSALQVSWSCIAGPRILSSASNDRSARSPGPQAKRCVFPCGWGVVFWILLLPGHFFLIIIIISTASSCANRPKEKDQADGTYLEHINPVPKEEGEKITSNITDSGILVCPHLLDKAMFPVAPVQVPAQSLTSRLLVPLSFGFLFLQLPSPNATT